MAVSCKVVNTLCSLMQAYTSCEYALLKTHSTVSHGSLIGKPLWRLDRSPKTDALLFSMYGLLDGCSPQCLIVQLELNIERGEFDASECSLV